NEDNYDNESLITNDVVKPTQNNSIPKKISKTTQNKPTSNKILRTTQIKKIRKTTRLKNTEKIIIKEIKEKKIPTDILSKERTLLFSNYLDYFDPYINRAFNKLHQSQKNALKEALDKGSCTLKLPLGYGKSIISLISALIVSNMRNDLPILIIVSKG